MYLFGCIYDMYTDMYMGMGMCICARVHVHAYVHTSIRTYKRTSMRAYVHTCICAYVHTCICEWKVHYCNGCWGLSLDDICWVGRAGSRAGQRREAEGHTYA